MITPTTKYKFQSWIFTGLLTILVGSLLAFETNHEGGPQTGGAPAIRKEVFKDFDIKNGQQLLNKHTEKEYNIHGKIIQYAEYKNDASGKAALNKLKIYKYDPSGNPIGTMLYNKHNDLIWSEEIQLNSWDQPTRVDHHTYEGKHKHTYTIYEYDEDGNSTLTASFEEDGEQTSEHKRSYNSDGEMTSSVKWFYTLVGEKLVKKITKTDHEYNEWGYLIRSTIETQEGRQKWKEIKLLENNFLVEWLKYKNGKLTSHFKHEKRDTVVVERQYQLEPPDMYQDPLLEYDDAKRDPLQNISHTPFRTTTIKRDNNGNLIKEVLREHGQVITVKYYYYDEAQNLVRTKKIFKLEGDTEEVLNKYDEYNNLLSHEIWFNDKIQHQQSFQYEYYER